MTSVKLQSSSILKVCWVPSRLTQEGVAYYGMRLAMAFQLCQYHKLNSPAYFKSINSCPRYEHTLSLAQSVRCIGPVACNIVRHRWLPALRSGDETTWNWLTNNHFWFRFGTCIVSCAQVCMHHTEAGSVSHFFLLIALPCAFFRAVQKGRIVPQTQRHDYAQLVTENCARLLKWSANLRYMSVIVINIL